jgi:Fe-S-cluster-containing hydrogenase component 2
MAFTDVLNTKKCFGCGMCAYSCDFGTFEMNTGSVKLKLAQGNVDVPIACRQSDIKRAREIALELKQRIQKDNFSIYDCL